MARVVGPPPPAPDWDRMDMRGMNGTRQAWGYISPDDQFITSDDGKVYMQVTKNMVSKKKGIKSAHIYLPNGLVRRLRHCLEWAKVVKKMFIFESKEGTKPPKKTIERPRPTGKELAMKYTKERADEKRKLANKDDHDITWEDLNDF